MRVVAVQPDIVWHDKSANHANYRRLLGGVDVPAGSLIVLPEMCDTGYSMDVPAVADADADADGRTVGFLRDLATGRRCWVIGGLVTVAADGRGLNQAAVVSPEGVEVARFTKIHPFTFAGEHERYAPGENRPCVVTCGEGDDRVTVCPAVCYDLRFPEQFRDAVAAGAQVLVIIANWPAARAEHWSTLLRARAIENQCCVVGVNRVGTDPNVAYAGGSVILDPRGHVLADAREREKVISAELDPSALHAYRSAFPVLRDVRR